ncbi:hypothetical protein GCM10027521_25810 [Amycolatopsis cihanbeyliensis]
MRSVKRFVSTLIGTLLLVAGLSTSASADEWNDLKNENTDRCLDDSFAYGLRPYTCNYGAWQEWELSFTENRTYVIIKNIKTGRCLDDSFRYGLRSYPCNGGDYQEFRNMPGGPDHGGEALRRFRNNATGRCVDDSVAYGLRGFACNGSGYQVWGPSFAH